MDTNGLGEEGQMNGPSQEEERLPKVELKYMSFLGKLEFKFDQDMAIPRNLSHINETVLEIKILTLSQEMPARALAAVDDSMRNVNFTWNISDFTKRQMDLQIYFEKAYEVTLDDQIKVEILKKELFASNLTSREIGDDNLNLQIQCKPQIMLEDKTAADLAAMASLGT